MIRSYSFSVASFWANILVFVGALFAILVAPPVLAQSSGQTSIGLNLTVSENTCNGNQSEDYFNIQNASGSSVKISDLSVKFWVFDTTPNEAMTAIVYYGGCMVDGNGNCTHTVSGAAATATAMTECDTSTGKANWLITVTNTDSTLMPTGYSWNNIQASINLANWAPFSPGSATWYSSCGGGQSFAANSTFGLYYQGNLVTSPGVGGTAPVCSGASDSSSNDTDSTTSPSDAASDSASAPSASPISCTALADAITATTGNVIVNSGATVDSYSSSAGAYGGSNVGTAGNIVAAGSITNNGGTINGQQTQNATVSLPVLTVPTTAINLPIGATSPGSVNINDASGTISLAPGSYVVQNLNVNYPGAINISPAGQVYIYVTGGLNLGGNENIGGVPANLTFVVTSSNWVNLNSNGTLVGNIYAPTSGISLNSTVDGYVVGSSVTLNSGGAVHFDVSDVCVGVPSSNSSTSIDADSHSITIAVTLPSGEQFVGISIRLNGVEILAQNVTGSEIPNGDGTSTYSYVLSGVTNGDQVDYQFDSRLPGASDFYTPGPADAWSTVCVSFDECLSSEYDSLMGRCTTIAASNGTACNDHNSCTTGDVCHSGVCSGSVAPNNANPSCLGEQQGLTYASKQPHRLPFPPTQNGCYVGTGNGWVEVPCGSSSWTQSNHLEVSRGGVYVPPAEQSAVSYVFAQVESTIIHTDKERNIDDDLGDWCQMGCFSTTKSESALFGLRRRPLAAEKVTFLARH